NQCQRGCGAGCYTSGFAREARHRCRHSTGCRRKSERQVCARYSRAQIMAGARPLWIAELWKELKQVLIAAKEDWDVWTDWYEARLQGKAFYEETETAKLRIAEEF